MTPREVLRLVETPDGIHASVLDPASPGVGLLMGLFAGSLVLAVSLVLIGPNALIVWMALVVATMIASLVTVHHTRFQHLRLGPRALHVRGQRIRQMGRTSMGNLSTAEIRSGADSRGLLGAPHPVRTMPYTSIRSMGCTDHSLWVELEDEQVEFDLQTLSPADIQRLFEALEPLWKRANEGVTDTEEAVVRNRQAIGQLTSS